MSVNEIRCPNCNVVLGGSMVDAISRSVENKTATLSEEAERCHRRLEEMKRENAELVAEVRRLREIRDEAVALARDGTHRHLAARRKLQADLKTAREALEFYASGKHVQTDEEHVLTHFETGTTAQAALAKLKAEG